ncbi:phenylacetic acid degradation protein [Sulfolobus sp. A20]|uniref:metal-sulfur cluster assembly factor n=1 Tax=Sulfolobaceae TaxID=118883 RepID=UPI000845D9B4|nr:MULTISPECIES: metal-sulfur cluster assembly factor [unclassified Sulfolobus]TRM76526.1 metal-sulfur cluster assembly factor [Sulfolobus sp. A20-N-F8]TRM80705.1 metal-sulfur cluster assembly factor [Sulfolobus sp. D5]TRM83873.1 metal-sulfur cluster assembly factor [Sulfolobus sp. A20-N-F6]TRM84870.1 metal-sulfur cluster assembly factor [Sulfolobus sp. F3]TRM88311.1 metal-sulfur cluster assembly factor [Sulfolobus sp. E3]TRM89468.1 metal-sulfur cluster assembly factor [Sulfolobus sp. C3]TRM
MVNIDEWKRKIMEGLKEVYDPEIPIDIVNLGLIYELKISGDGDVYIRVGATTPACPVTEDLVYTVEQVIKETVSAKSIKVDLDLDTRWTPLMMTEEGREQFKQKYGYDIVQMWKLQYGEDQ